MNNPNKGEAEGFNDWLSYEGEFQNNGNHIISHIFKAIHGGGILSLRNGDRYEG